MAYIAVNAGRHGVSAVRAALTAYIAVNAGRTGVSAVRAALAAYIAVNAGRAVAQPGRPVLTDASERVIDAAVQTPAPPGGSNPSPTSAGAVSRGTRG
jgi:hypothetical protein